MRRLYESFDSWPVPDVLWGLLLVVAIYFGWIVYTDVWGGKR